MSPRPRSRVGLLLGLLASLLTPSTRADTIQVAVASNFGDAARELAAIFHTRTGHDVSLSLGSTGKLHAQITHGAPYDVFLAADVARPRLLEESGTAVPGTRATYARGRLALWVPGRAALPDPEGWLRAAGYAHLALANPDLAPYGRAARQVLERLELWEPLRPRLVQGENVGQAFQFVAGGAAQGGLVALAQVRRPGAPAPGATWVVPAELHDPVEQQVVLLRDRPEARAFLSFLVGPGARPTLDAYGYARPGEPPPLPAREPETPSGLTAADMTALSLTLKLASVTTVLLLVLGTPLAWWLARTRARLRSVVEAVVALPIVLPPTVLGFYLLVLLGPQGPVGKLLVAAGSEPWVFRFEGLVIGSLVYSLPFVVQPLQASFEALDDRVLEAAATLRASPLDRFLHVVVPLARPGFVTAAVLGFAHTLGEFGVVLMIGGNIPGETKVLSIAIYDHVETLEYARAHTLAQLMLVLSFLLLLAVYSTNRRLLRTVRT